jgi:DNA-binding NtrC family response regulator
VPPSCLLIVDDEAALTSLLAQYLRRTGYEVDACEDATQALSLLAAHPGRYAALVTDLALPGVSGEDLVDRARTQTPALRAIITSGYAYKPHQPGVEFLQKPFFPKALGELLEKMLKG